MPTECNAQQLESTGVERRRVVAAFDAGRISSHAGALLLKSCDAAIGLLDRLARGVEDRRDPDAIEFPLRVLLAAVRVLRAARTAGSLVPSTATPAPYPVQQPEPGQHQPG